MWSRPSWAGCYALVIGYTACVRRLATCVLLLTWLPTWGQSIDVQEPGSNIEFGGGVVSRLEYRDLFIGSQAGLTAYLGAAQGGFSASLWIAKAGSEPTAHEAFLAYSHKLPWVDVHVGYVNFRLPEQFGGGDDALRVSITNNLSHHTHVELLFDSPLGDGRRSRSLSLAHIFGTASGVEVGVRASTSVWNVDGHHLNGTSVRLLARTGLSPKVYLNVEAGLIRSDTGVSPASRRSGGQVGLTLLRQY